MNEENSIKMLFPDFVLSPDLPCVVFDKISQVFFKTFFKSYFIQSGGQADAKN